jgi:RNA polymerase sigma-70 factor, ECF subfamily
MNGAASGEVTLLLRDLSEGSDEAASRLVSLLYDPLRALAAAQLRRERSDHTLTPTALVHEAYLKLAPGAAPDARDRAHFLAIAARVMRQVLVDHARSHNARKRGGDWARATLTDEVAEASGMDLAEILALDAALASLPERQRRVVECRVFGGMEEIEIATALGISERTVRRDWVKARARLIREMREEGPGAESG